MPIDTRRAESQVRVAASREILQGRRDVPIWDSVSSLPRWDSVSSLKPSAEHLQKHLDLQASSADALCSQELLFLLLQVFSCSHCSTCIAEHILHGSTRSRR